MLSSILKFLGADVTGLVAAEFLLIEDLKKARKFVRSHPELLGDAYLAKLEKSARSKEVEDYALGRRALLRLCNEVGVERAFDMWEADVLRGPELLHALIHSSESSQVISLLKEHPGLTDESSVSALGRILEAPQFADGRDFYANLQRIVKAVRAIGADALLEHLAESPPIVAIDPPEESDVVDECEKLLHALLKRPLSEFPQWIRRYPAAAANHAMDRMLFHEIRSNNNYEDRLRIGLARARLARVRRVGIEKALAEDWRPGGMPPEYKASNLDFERAPALTLAELLRRYATDPDLLEGQLSWNEQIDFMDPFPAPVFPAEILPLALALGQLSCSPETMGEAFAATDAIVGAIQKADVGASAGEILAWAFYRTTRATDFAADHDRNIANIARELLEQVIELTEASAPLDRAAALSALAALGPGWDEEGYFDPATFGERVGWLNQGIALLSPEGIRTAELRLQLGSLLLDMGNAEKALSEILRARACLPQGPNLRLDLKTYLKEGEARLAAGDDSGAETAFAHAIDLFDEDLRSSVAPLGMDDTAARRAAASRLAGLAIGRQGRAREALQAVERARAQQFMEQMDILQVPSAQHAGLPEAARALLKSRLVISPTDVSLGDHQDPRAYGEAVRAHKTKVREKWEELGGTALVMPDIAAAVSEELGPNEALISLSTTKYGSYAIVIDADVGVSFFEVPSFTDQVLHNLLIDRTTPRISGWLADLPNATEDYDAARATLHKVLHELQSLILPVIDRLPISTKSLRIVLDAKLALLPVHAVELEDGTALMDHYELSYSPSAAMLVRAAKAPVEGRGLCAVAAGPEANLIYAEVEAQKIAGLFADGVVIAGSGDVFPALEGELARRAWIHIASHADVDLENAALRFDRGDLSLEAFRSGELSLATGSTITLSCCRTGLIDLRADDEKVGFAASLIASGARGAVTTLWEIDDFPAALLMAEFYRSVASDAAAAQTALRKSQRWLRLLDCNQVAELAQAWASDLTGAFLTERRVEAHYWAEQAARTPSVRPFADPFHWAPYTYSGY